MFKSTTGRFEDIVHGSLFTWTLAHLSSVRLSPESLVVSPIFLTKHRTDSPEARHYDRSPSRSPSRPPSSHSQSPKVKRASPVRTVDSKLASSISDTTFGGGGNEDVGKGRGRGRQGRTGGYGKSGRGRRGDDRGPETDGDSRSDSDDEGASRRRPKVSLAQLLACDFGKGSAVLGVFLGNRTTVIDFEVVQRRK